MRGVIISAGNIEDYAFAAAQLCPDDFVICADGGLAHAQAMGVTPQLIVGDFDSYPGALPQGENVVPLPREKDYTDTHTAVIEAKKRGITEILLLGASGSRLDHTLANIALLEAMRRSGIRACMVDKHNRLFLAENRQIVYGKAGDVISLIPLGKVSGLTLTGFKYPLSNADIELFNPVWVSNELLSERAEISFKSGILLVDAAAD